MLGLLLVLIVLAPAESRLGNVVKLVYVHGALVWVGLALFSIAGAIALVALVSRRAIWYRGAEAVSQAALLVWIVYAISSMAVTGLTWGQVIAWSEPRVRATALILMAALLFALAARLVGHRDFSALVNAVMGILPWVAVQRAEIVRHPANPIGGSGSAAIEVYYLLIVATVACLGATLVAWIWTGLEARKDR